MSRTMRVEKSGGAEPQTQEPLLLNRTDVAALLRISVFTLDQWREAGYFPEPTVSRDDASGRPRIVRWSRGVIERWVADGCRAPGRGKAGAR